MYNRDQLVQLFHERALKFGDFTLASGKKSKYYLDGKQITLHSQACGTSAKRAPVGTANAEHDTGVPIASN